MQSYYDIDLTEAIWGDEPMSSRRLLSLVGSLPMMSDPEHFSLAWGAQEELLAQQLEAFIMVNSAEPKPSLPIVVRPWTNDEKPVQSSDAELAAFVQSSRVMVKR